ncbi:ankyrin repeat-containing domain protein [Nemania sp. FL0031]|nr:ankyrin repeat-containing domain protein [Nemania sp. FL0031]
MGITHWGSWLCDDKLCRDGRQRKIDLVYQIPLFRYAIWLRLTWISIFGPGASLYLRVARVVTNHGAFYVAQYGTPQMLQYMFDSKRGLPTDITLLGKTMLHAASTAFNWGIVDCLLELGADAFQMDSGSSPISWVQYLTMSCPPWTCPSSKLQVLAEEDYNSNSREYPLHDALNRCTDAELEFVLNEHPSRVYEPAEFNITPLHRATALQRYSAMELLLLRGADPMKQDRYGLIPLYYAIRRDDYRATEILLRVTNVSDLVHLYGDALSTMALRCSSSKTTALLLSAGSTVKRLGLGSPGGLASRRLRGCQEYDDLEAILRHLLNIVLDSNDCSGLLLKQAIQWDNLPLLRALVKSGDRFC